MSNRRYAVVTAAHADSKVWRPEGPYSWRDFLGALALDEPADAKECGGYAPVTLAGTRRVRSQVRSRSIATLDADDAGPDFRDVATKVLGGVQHAAHTTWRHTAEAPRWRLLVPLSRDVTPGEYRLVVGALLHDLGAERFDPGSAEPERFMWRPSARDGSYEHWVATGRPLTVGTWLERAEDLGLDATPEPAFRGGPVADLDVPPTAFEISKARAVLAKACREIEADRTGGRNNGCIRWLPVLYQFVLGDCLDEGEVDSRVYAASLRAPAADRDWGEAEFREVSGNAWAYAQVDGPLRPDTETANDVFSALPVAERRPGFPEASGGAAAEALAACHAAFRRWFGPTYDLDTVDLPLAAAAVERLDGDPLWALLVGGPGAAKTETVQTLGGAGALVESTIASEGGLLSGTSRKDRDKDATGGLLRRLEPDGVLVLKDVTSILTMSRDARGAVLGALREVYDGRWTRNVGTDGGRTLTWGGRIAVVGAVTTAWDQHHEVVAAMGDRFVLLRLGSDDGRLEAGRQALRNTGSEAEMRAELAAAVRAVVAAMDPGPVEPTEAEVETLLAAADLVTRARTAVVRDFKGEPEAAHAAEMPTRFAKQLLQVLRGGVAVGLARGQALALAMRCARDSVPPLRLRVLGSLAAHGEASAYDMAARLDEPRTTVRREMDALHLLGLVRVVREAPYTTRGGDAAVKWIFDLATDADPAALGLARLPDDCRDLL
jgi:hypothetical protein